MRKSGVTGRTLHRSYDQRRLLFKTLASQLIDNGSIETTKAKAKALLPYVEKLISKAVRGTTRDKQLARTKVANDESIKNLFAAKEALSNRTGGHLRIVNLPPRRGDNAQMARIEFVDNITNTTSTQPTKLRGPKAKSSKSTKSVPSPKQPQRQPKNTGKVDKKPNVAPAPPKQEQKS